jgi:hypothetical protein
MQLLHETGFWELAVKITAKPFSESKGGLGLGLSNGPSTCSKSG